MTAAFSHPAVLHLIFHWQHRGPHRRVSLKPVTNCVVFICFWGLFIPKKKRGVWVGDARQLSQSAHVPVQHPGHISTTPRHALALLCCWNMKYAWTIKSIWTIYLNIRYGGPSETIIKAGWRTRAPARKKSTGTSRKTCARTPRTVRFISFTADFVLSAHRERRKAQKTHTHTRAGTHTHHTVGEVV